MTKTEFRDWIGDYPVFLDGATGSNLMDAGMPMGCCPEEWILEHSEVLCELQKKYVEAGTNILYAPTFTANRIKLEEYGLQDKVEEINMALVELSRQASGGKAMIAGDLTMCGKQLYPMGDLEFEELVEVYKEQIQAIEKAGVDLYVVETMMSLQESRAALIALKETTEKPVMVSMTYNEDGRTLYGTDPMTATVVLQSLGADAVGLNCSTGPEGMIPLIEEMAKVAQVPILAKPNAGMPELEDGITVYRMGPEEFAGTAKALVEAGASILGGCCGTTPAHIRALVDAVGDMEVPKPKAEPRRILTSERKSVEIDLDGSFLVIGERINPTGKKKLQAELKEGNLDLVRTMAREQEENGASILDVNMGMNGIDEKAMMLEVVQEVASIVDCPLCIDSSHVDIIEAALRIYPGRALINSISLESEKFEKLIPIAKKYGAMFILLPLSDAGLPKDAEEKHQIIHTILDAALKEGLKKEDIVVDGLVATVGANPNAAVECYETIAYCKDTLGLATVCGLSNISFGLPERMYVNATFLTMAIAKGLTMAIANPSQELLMNAAFASDMLLNKKDGDLRYIQHINHIREKKEPEGEKVNPEKTKREQKSQVFEAVLKGSKGSILKEVDLALEEGIKPSTIIDEHLIPAINEVGNLFDKKIYFLPQLISSAQTMEQAITYLEPMLEQDKDGEQKATIIMATVEGDIHDIGKNLVVLMLKNYGYHVIDLGKDVAAERILNAALEENAQIIGLSALMTTTMMRMKDVVDLAKEKGYTGKIIVGGAVITPSFAEEIGADGYSTDAADCVKLVGRLLGE